MAGKTPYFTEIVGLRIYLAAWVAIGHALQLAGFLEPTNPLLRILLSGHDAVILFMIVSGFVITNLLEAKQEPYLPYITRRFFRLFPAYVLACAAGYFLIDDWANIVDTVPWASAPAAVDYAKGIHELRDQVTYNFAPHFAAHAVMLHGLIPDEILLRAPMTFLPAAWSISLEWQFYLLAPLILAAFKSGGRTIALIVISLLLFGAFKIGVLGHYAIDATIAANIQFFLLGIVSRLLHERLSSLAVSPLLGTTLVLFVSAVAIRNPLALTIWGIFYSYSLWHRNAPITGRVFRLLTQSRPFQILGEASYSLYLIHRPLQVGLISLLMGSVALTQYSVLAIQIAATLLALPISIVLYLSVEKWGIRLGHRVANRFRPNPSAKAVPVA